MNKTLQVSLLLLSTLIVFTCKSNDPNQIEEEITHEKLMEVHDEVMPKMGEINSLRNKLIKISKDNSINENDLAVVNEAIKYLEQADDSMMDWMGEYKKPSKLRKEKSHEEIMSYLKAEKIKIEQVKYDMLAGINAANELLKKY